MVHYSRQRASATVKLSSSSTSTHGSDQHVSAFTSQINMYKYPNFNALALNQDDLIYELAKYLNVESNSKTLRQWRDVLCANFSFKVQSSENPDQVFKCAAITGTETQKFNEGHDDVNLYVAIEPNLPLGSGIKTMEFLANSSPSSISNEIVLSCENSAANQLLVTKGDFDINADKVVFRGNPSNTADMSVAVEMPDQIAGTILTFDDAGTQTGVCNMVASLSRMLANNEIDPDGTFAVKNSIRTYMNSHVAHTYKSLNDLNHLVKAFVHGNQAVAGRSTAAEVLQYLQAIALGDETTEQKLVPIGAQENSSERKQQEVQPGDVIGIDFSVATNMVLSRAFYKDGNIIDDRTLEVGQTIAERSNLSDITAVEAAGSPKVSMNSPVLVIIYKEVIQKEDIINRCNYFSIELASSVSLALDNPNTKFAPSSVNSETWPELSEEEMAKPYGLGHVIVLREAEDTADAGNTQLGLTVQFLNIAGTTQLGQSLHRTFGNLSIQIAAKDLKLKSLVAIRDPMQPAQTGVVPGRLYCEHMSLAEDIDATTANPAQPELDDNTGQYFTVTPRLTAEAISDLQSVYLSDNSRLQLCAGYVGADLGGVLGLSQIVTSSFSADFVASLETALGINAALNIVYVDELVEDIVLDRMTRLIAVAQPESINFVRQQDSPAPDGYSVADLPEGMNAAMTAVGGGLVLKLVYFKSTPAIAPELEQYVGTIDSKNQVQAKYNLLVSILDSKFDGEMVTDAQLEALGVQSVQTKEEALPAQVKLAADKYIVAAMDSSAALNVHDFWTLRPSHDGVVNYDYKVAATPMTQAEFFAFLGNAPNGRARFAPSFSSVAEYTQLREAVKNSGRSNVVVAKVVAGNYPATAGTMVDVSMVQFFNGKYHSTTFSAAHQTLTNAGEPIMVYTEADGQEPNNFDTKTLASASLVRIDPSGAKIYGYHEQMVVMINPDSNHAKKDGRDWAAGREGKLQDEWLPTDSCFYAYIELDVSDMKSSILDNFEEMRDTIEHNKINNLATVTSDNEAAAETAIGTSAANLDQCETAIENADNTKETNISNNFNYYEGRLDTAETVLTSNYRSQVNYHARATHDVISYSYNKGGVAKQREWLLRNRAILLQLVTILMNNFDIDLSNYPAIQAILNDPHGGIGLPHFSSYALNNYSDDADCVQDGEPDENGNPTEIACPKSTDGLFALFDSSLGDGWNNWALYYTHNSNYSYESGIQDWYISIPSTEIVNNVPLNSS